MVFFCLFASEVESQRDLTHFTFDEENKCIFHIATMFRRNTNLCVCVYCANICCFIISFLQKDPSLKSSKDLRVRIILVLFFSRLHLLFLFATLTDLIPFVRWWLLSVPQAQWIFYVIFSFEYILEKCIEDSLTYNINHTSIPLCLVCNLF